MEFFDKLGKKASEAYKVTADKTGKIAKEAKLRMHIGELKSQIKDIYVDIGKKVYEKHVREEELDISKDLEEACTKIDVLSDEIDSSLKECLELKDKKQCQKCFKEIEKDMKFCPECGAKQEETPAKEVEILEKLENADIKSENEKEAETIKEDLKEGLENLEGLNNKEKNEDNNYSENLKRTVEVESDPQENLSENFEYNEEDKIQ